MKLLSIFHHTADILLSHCGYSFAVLQMRNEVFFLNIIKANLIMKNAVNWFEIPSADFERAVKFYSAMYDTSLTISEEEDGLMKMCILPHEYQGGVGGCIIHHEKYQPGSSGTLVYLNAGDDVTPMVERAVQAGGSIILPKMKLPKDLGHIAIISDSEGNSVGLHSFN